VPGDPLVGGLLAIGAAASGGAVSPWRIGIACAASLLIYAGGLIQNDCFDFAEDRKDRPGRPLPSGRVSLGAAILVSSILAVAGAGLAILASPASGTAALVLLVVMTLYNAAGKRLAVVGPILMGLCRGLSVLIGAGVFGWSAFREPAVLIAACGISVFIATVTAIARRETLAFRVGPRRWIPAGAIAATLASLISYLPWAWLGSEIPPVAPFAVWAVFWALYCGRLLEGTPAPRTVQKAVGAFIGGLLFFQAALAAAASPVGDEGLIAPVCMLVAWPLFRLTARWFYSS
jgi:4-hydroxybenzoate polyprenyltransferase